VYRILLFRDADPSQPVAALGSPRHMPFGVTTPGDCDTFNTFEQARRAPGEWLQSSDEADDWVLSHHFKIR
jgi:hypothetical protein